MNFSKYTLAIGFLVVACSSAPPVKEFANTADPDVEMTAIETRIQKDQNEQIDILSPKNFTKAADTLAEAHASREKNLKQVDVLHQIALAQAYLSQAEKSAEVAQQVLSKTTHERSLAIAAGAPQLFAKEFISIDKDLKSATMEVEDKDTAEATTANDKLAARYSDLELQSLLKSNLGQARSELGAAKDEGAAKYAPQTLLWATGQIDTAQNSITSDRHNSENLQNSSERANRASERLLRIVRQAKSSSQQSPEQLAKQLEADQQEALAAANEASIGQARTQSQLTAADKRIAAQSKNISGLGAANSKLEDQQRLETQYAAAAQLFNKDEAEVYKKGNSLWLRLKGLHFPVAQSTIPTDDYPLLAKVQTVISNSQSSAIRIEGHTDSTGSKAVNDKLSQARAEAIGKYLAANDAQVLPKLNAQGFGDSQPLATNKTVAGRAQNRRVDIEIQEVSSK